MKRETTMADSQRSTPQLDELEKGPWPSFVTQIKEMADEGKEECEQLLGLLEDPAFAVRQFARQSLWDHLAESPQETMVDVNKWADAQPQALSK